MFGIFGSIAKAVVTTTYSKTASQSMSQQSSSSSGSSANSKSSSNNATKTNVQTTVPQRTSGSTVATAVKKVAEGVVVSISDQAKAAAAKAGVASGTVVSTANKGQHMQADKGPQPFYKNMVDIGYSPSSTPSKNANSTVSHGHQNDIPNGVSTKNSDSKVYGHQNDIPTGVSANNPYNKAVEEALERLRNDPAVKKANASSSSTLDKNLGVVALKEAYSRTGDQATTDAISLIVNDLRWKGATIGANVTLEEAKKQVAKESMIQNKGAYSFGLDVIPGIGGIKNVYEAVTGKDAVTKEPLSVGERILAGASFGFPGKAGVKAVNGLVDMVDDVKTVGKTDNLKKADEIKTGERSTVTSNKGTVINDTPSAIHTTTTSIPNPAKGTPNSSVDIVRADTGEIKTRRFYGPDGRAVRDVDYTHHGNPKQHPEWPHEHMYEWDENGKMKRLR